MPAVVLSRAGAHVVGSGPGGEDLAAGAWQRLEALPDPRSPQGRIYPLPCLIAVAVRAFTAAGNDRLAAVGQQTRRASQADLARLRAPWDPDTGRYRAPDEKTIRVVLDKLDPRARARALPCPGRAAAVALAGGSRRGYVITGPGAPPRRRKRWPAAGYGPWPWTARPPAEPAALTAPGCIFPASPSTAAACWATSRPTSSTMRPATSPHSWNPWTWPVPWSPPAPSIRCGRTRTGWPGLRKAITSPS